MVDGKKKRCVINAYNGGNYWLETHFILDESSESSIRFVCITYVMLRLTDTPGTCLGCVNRANVETESMRQAENPPWSKPAGFVCSSSTWNSTSQVPSPPATIFTYIQVPCLLSFR